MTQNNVEQVNAALTAFFAAGADGNSSELASKLQELLLLIKASDKSLAQMIPLEPLVAALDVYGWNEEVCKGVFGLMELIIQTSSFPDLIEKYDSALTSSARHPDSDLARLSVEALKLGIVDEYLPILVQSDFFIAIIKRLASPDAELADAIFKVVLASNLYPAYPAQIEDLLREAAQEQGVEEAFIAALEILCALRKKVLNSSSVYLGLSDYVMSNDLMMQLCALQIIVQNADSQHDFDLLSGEGGILEYLVDKLPAEGEFILNDEPIYCKATNLFSNLMRVPSTNWAHFEEKIMTGLKVCLKEWNEAQKDAIILTSALLGNNSMVKNFNIVKQSYLDLFSTSDTSVRAACLYSASLAFSHALSLVDKEEVLQKGLGTMGTKSPYENLQAQCSSGLDEVKDAAYDCLHKMLMQKELAARAMTESDLFTFLVNRPADPSTSGLNAKYQIIQELSKQDWVPSVFNEPMRRTFAKYLSQGIFYNDIAGPSVAMQS